MSAYISRTGFTKVGDHWGKSLSELAFEATRPILEDANVKPDALIISNTFAELTSSQSNLGPLIADALGLIDIEALSVESSGASGAAAVHVAVNLIGSGHAKSVLVVGVEKMRDLEPSKLVGIQGLSASAEYSQFFGISFASLNALLARIYMNEYSITRQNLSAFPVIAHRNSATSEHSQFRKKFTNEEVSRSELISDPIRVLDCAPVGDGAASLLIIGDDLAKSEKASVRIDASETSSFGSNVFERQKMLHFSSTDAATKRALKSSGKTIQDVDFLEIHDSYSILAALEVEAMGFSKAGTSCIDAEEGKFDLHGKFPISTFGGMKGRGYPVGAAGIYQFCEAFAQLAGKAGPNQVKDPETGLLHAMSGIDESSFVHILSRS